jgi:hypothetical protein
MFERSFQWETVRVFERSFQWQILHSRMPLDPTHARLKRSLSDCLPLNDDNGKSSGLPRGIGLAPRMSVLQAEQTRESQGNLKGAKFYLNTSTMHRMENRLVALTLPFSCLHERRPPV